MRIHLPLGSLWVGEGEGEAAEIFPRDQANHLPPPPPVPLTEGDESNPSVRTLNWGTQFGPHGQGNELIGPPDPVIVSWCLRSRGHTGATPEDTCAHWEWHRHVLAGNSIRGANRRGGRYQGTDTQDTQRRREGKCKLRCINRSGSLTNLITPPEGLPGGP